MLRSVPAMRSSPAAYSMSLAAASSSSAASDFALSTVSFAATWIAEAEHYDALIGEQQADDWAIDARREGL